MEAVMDHFGWLLLAAMIVIVLMKGARSSRFLARSPIIAIVLLTIAGCAGGEYDPGGDMILASTRATNARADNKHVEIRGICYSACALKLASGNGVCVAPSAWIGVHEVRRTTRRLDYAGGFRDDLLTEYFERMLPRCARDLYDARHGFDSGRLVVATGSEILGACPTIHRCLA
jgi:hypothetical protein